MKDQYPTVPVYCFTLHRLFRNGKYYPHTVYTFSLEEGIRSSLIEKGWSLISEELFLLRAPGSLCQKMRREKRIQEIDTFSISPLSQLNKE